MDRTIEDLLKFLQIGARYDLKLIAIKNLLNFTGTDDGIKLISTNNKLLISLLSLLNDNSMEIRKNALLCFINLSTNLEISENIMNLPLSDVDTPPLQNTPNNIVETILDFILTTNQELAHPTTMLLSNLTRCKSKSDWLIDLIGPKTDQLIALFTKDDQHLHYLATVFSNLTSNQRMQNIMIKNIEKILPYISYEKSLIRRGGIIGTIRNCCFNLDAHDWLLDEKGVNILPYLLLPLAGGEQFDDDDNDQLPIELQYLDETKTRESDPDLKLMLLECLLKLTTKKSTRCHIREKNTYIILRELHKNENNPEILLTCENLINLLIRTEDEIGAENLNTIDIPAEIHEKFLM